ncbi:MAG: hypothetical protein WC679_04215 [Bacteroidales bacterium]
MSSVTKFWIYTLVSLVLVGSVLMSCVSEEDYATDKSIKLRFSSDTLRFDTIFTTMGSVTKTIMVYNKESKPIKIDQIRLGGGRSSFYRLNVDGDTNIIVKDIEIAAKDSMYIFARVTIDPTNQNNPLLVSDSIIFSFNNKEQYVQLEAYGQDAYYHVAKRDLGSTGIKYCLAQDGGLESGCIINGNNLEWKNDKPHVIFGVLAVDSAYTLNITEGTRICLNTTSNFWVYTDATLKVNGSIQNPVIFEGMRRDGYYASLPGQWGQLWFWAGSKNSTINNAIIKNGTIGLVADSCVTTNNPTVDINNTRIENMSYYGLFSRGANINGTNLIIQNSGKETVALTMGGKYQFVNCTFANYWSYDSRRTTKTLLLNNYYNALGGSIQLRPITECNFYNTIVYGSTEEEITIDKAEGANLIYKFESSLLKTNILNSQSQTTNNCIFNQDPLFNIPDEGDLRVKANSPAIGNGNGIYSSYYAPFDITGYPRPSNPTIGALEYVLIPQEKAKYLSRR